MRLAQLAAARLCRGFRSLPSPIEIPDNPRFNGFRRSSYHREFQIFCSRRPTQVLSGGVALCCRFDPFDCCSQFSPAVCQPQICSRYICNAGARGQICCRFGTPLIRLDAYFRRLQKQVVHGISLSRRVAKHPDGQTVPSQGIFPSPAANGPITVVTRRYFPDRPSANFVRSWLRICLFGSNDVANMRLLPP